MNVEKRIEELNNKTYYNHKGSDLLFTFDIKKQDMEIEIYHNDYYITTINIKKQIIKDIYKICKELEWL